MGTFSIWHWLIVLVIVLLLFGAGKIPKLMGDMAKGVKEFKKGLNEDGEQPKGTQSEPQKLDSESAAKPAEKDPAKH